MKDSDQNQLLSLKEYTQAGFDSNSDHTQFRQADVDQDGALSFKEFQTLKYHNLSPASVFDRFDTNLDGELDSDEITLNAGSWQKQLVKYIFPGFDTDNNHSLSLTEFLHTPLSNPLGSWYNIRKDLDGNDLLDFSEYLTESSPSCLSLQAHFFSNFDLNDDKYLSAEEYFFTSNLNSRKQFDLADKNNDGALDETEYLATLKPEHQKVGQRDFRLYDQNSDQRMEFDEYRGTPAVPLAQRQIPDPVIDRVRQQLSTFPKADQNNDSQLSIEELKAAFPELADQHNNKPVARDDLQRLLDIAYGVRTLDGQLLREPSGRVVNWMLFTHLDTDHSGQLSAGELKPQFKQDQQLTKFFQQADQNKDQQISLKEWKTTDLCWIDPVYYFKRIDKDGNARLTAAELASDTGFHRELAPYLIPAFDGNGDGVLSLYEYRDTPITNPLVQWHVQRKDLDHDGMLSAAEFDWKQGLVARTLIQDYFHRLDQDRNQRLDQREFLLQLNLIKAPREIVFKNLDKNNDQYLSFEEIFVATKRLINSKDTIKYEKIMSNVDNVFNQLDLDHNSQLNLKEFQQDQALAVLPPYSYNTRSFNRIKSNLPISRTESSKLATESNFTLWVTLILNILLVSLVFYYLLKVKLRK
ncbi:EF-hand domain-containing protein [Gimesia alba]|uniref:EF-hand domain-containing protein n=1 Tax=Gimesia alba TaxID=2527973 RepID=UPI0018D6803F|nr:EF-hand domain-containing protein [Gimesia alba]